MCVRVCFTISHLSVTTYSPATLALSIFATVAGISLFSFPSDATASAKPASTRSCLSSGSISNPAPRLLFALALPPSSPPSSVPSPSPSPAVLASTCAPSLAFSRASSSAVSPARNRSENADAVAAGTRRLSAAISRSRSSSSRARASTLLRLRPSKGSCCSSGAESGLDESPEDERNGRGSSTWRPLIVMFGAAWVNVRIMYYKSKTRY